MKAPRHTFRRLMLAMVGTLLLGGTLAAPAVAGEDHPGYSFRAVEYPQADCDSVTPTAFSPSLTYAVAQCERFDARPNDTLVVNPQGARVVASKPAVDHPTISYVRSVADDGWAAGVVMEAAPVPNGLTLMPALWSPTGELHLGRDVVAGQRVAVVNSVVFPGGALLASVEAQPSRSVATWYWTPGRAPVKLTPPEGFTEVRILHRGSVSRAGEATLSLMGPHSAHALARWSPTRGLRLSAPPDGYTAFEPYAASDSGQYVLGRGDRADGSDIMVVGRQGSYHRVKGIDAANAGIDDHGNVYGRGLRDASGARPRLLKVTPTHTVDLTQASQAPSELPTTVAAVHVAGHGAVAVRYQRGDDELFGVLEPADLRRLP